MAGIIAGQFISAAVPAAWQIDKIVKHPRQYWLIFYVLVLESGI